MGKSIKAAAAASAAAVLLLGGATTLAYWSDSSPLAGGAIASGQVALGDANCAGGWVYGPGNASAGQPVGLIVPGDTIVKACTFTVTMTGDNVTATLTTPDSAAVVVTSTPQPSSLVLNVDATYVDQDGAAVPAQMTTANNGDVLTASLAVEFPFGNETTINANDTQSLAATLDSITVTLAQTDA